MRCNNKIIRFLAYFSFYSRKATGVHNKTKRQNFSKWQMTHSVGTAIVPTKRWTHTTSAASAPNGFAYFFRWFSQTENPFGFGLLFVCIVLKKESRRRPTRPETWNSLWEMATLQSKLLGAFVFVSMPCHADPWSVLWDSDDPDFRRLCIHNKKKTILAVEYRQVLFGYSTSNVKWSDGWWMAMKYEKNRNSEK